MSRTTSSFVRKVLLCQKRQNNLIKKQCSIVIVKQSLRATCKPIFHNLINRFEIIKKSLIFNLSVSLGQQLRIKTGSELAESKQQTPKPQAKPVDPKRRSSALRGLRRTQSISQSQSQDVLGVLDEYDQDAIERWNNSAYDDALKEDSHEIIQLLSNKSINFKNH